MHVDETLDPAEILRSPDLDVVPYAERVAALAAHLGLAFPATLRALESIPLCLSRSDHPAARRTMAEMIAARTDVLKQRIPGMVANRMAPLSRPGAVDMMASVVTPLVDDMISGLLDLPLQVGPDTLISRVFSQSLGVAKRRRLEAELAQLIAELETAFPQDDARTIGLKLSLAILGRDALTGTLACSLHAVLAAAPGQPLSAMDWPDLPPRTGVPYIDRMARRGAMIGSHPIPPGDTIRAWLARYETAEDPRARLSFFGAGAHLCLGRALSLDLWRSLATALRGLRMIPTITDYQLRRDDVFHLPQSFTIKVLAP